MGAAITGRENVRPSSSSDVSTGVFDQTGVNDVLGGSGTSLGNGETGYAIQGAGVSYLKVADICRLQQTGRSVGGS